MPRLLRALLLGVIAAGLLASCKDDSSDDVILCSLDSISPTSGDPAGGEVLTLSGAGFQAGTEVVIGTTLASGVTLVDGSTLTVTTPTAPALGWPVDVTVISPSGLTCTLVDAFTYNGTCGTSACGCILVDVAPSECPVEGGATVLIVGAGFFAGVEVAFGTELSPQVIIDPPGYNPSTGTLIEATVPSSAIPGTVDVTVLNQTGTVCRLEDGFDYGTGCSLISVTPDQVCTYIAEEITLTGYGFQSGAKVHFNDPPGLQASAAPKVNVVDGSTILALSPHNQTTPGVGYDVLVENPDGRTCYLREALTSFMLPPTGSCFVTNVTPSTGSVLGGESVVISGTGFEATDRVTFGFNEVPGPDVSFDPVSGDLTVVTPPGDRTGPAELKVVDAACAKLPCIASFTYQ